MINLNQPNTTMLFRLTKLLLSAVTVDAALLYLMVVGMTEDPAIALDRYHAVPEMAEHLLAAVVLYLICMILIEKVRRA